MPGLEKSRSPSVLAAVRRSSAFGITVTVANWSVTIGSAPSGNESVLGSVADGSACPGRRHRGYGRRRSRRRTSDDRARVITAIRGSRVWALA